MCRWPSRVPSTDDVPLAPPRSDSRPAWRRAWPGVAAAALAALFTGLVAWRAWPVPRAALTDAVRLRVATRAGLRDDAAAGCRDHPRRARLPLPGARWFVPAIDRRAGGAAHSGRDRCHRSLRVPRRTVGGLLLGSRRTGPAGRRWGVRPAEEDQHQRRVTRRPLCGEHSTRRELGRRRHDSVRPAHRHHARVRQRRRAGARRSRRATTKSCTALSSCPADEPSCSA